MLHVDIFDFLRQPTQILVGNLGVKWGAPSYRIKRLRESLVKPMHLSAMTKVDLMQLPTNRLPLNLGKFLARHENSPWKSHSLLLHGRTRRRLDFSHFPALLATLLNARI
jgi:hypothetical protein